MKWTRLSASWSGIEKEMGKYNWEATDKAFVMAIKEGITPFITIGGANKLYTKPIPGKDPKLLEIYGSNPAPPTNNKKAFQAWLKFVEAVVERYKDQINYWEVWNEPNHHHYWGAEPNGKDYGILLRESAKVIRKTDPDAIVLGGSMAGLDPTFTEDFLSVGTENLIDIITYHNYGAIPEQRIYKAVEVLNVIKKYNPKIELWQGECGYPSHSSSRDYRGISPWGLNIQAKWLLRQAFTDVYFCEATMSNYFKMYHGRGRGKMPKRSNLSAVDSILGFPERNGSRVKSVGVNEKCLLENPGLEPKPAFYAYQNLCALVDKRYAITKLEYQINIKETGVFYGIGPEDDAFPSIPLVAAFKTKNDNFLVAYWLPWHPQEITKPATIDFIIESVKFNNPVLVDLLTGKVFSLDDLDTRDSQLIFGNLPLNDYPLAIVEKEEIQIIKNKN